MNQSTVNRILDIQDAIRSDPEMMAEYHTHHTAFLAMLPQLTESQRNTILDYLGVGIELHLRMLALACDPDKEK